MSTITINDKLACAQRELEMRQRVYPRQVASGKLTQTKADREIAVMRAIVQDYVRCSQVDLFPDDAG
jgi:hypothetical protein